MYGDESEQRRKGSGIVRIIKKITEKELEEILELHEKWLRGEETGIRADLSDVDLACFDLSYARLGRANLNYANLSDAILIGANLVEINLIDANLNGSDLTNANLTRSSLIDADLRNANLSNANLINANLDFSAMSLWCGDLLANYDDKQIIQQLYHVFSHIQNSTNVSSKLKEKFLVPELIEVVNEFHRAEECGKIKENSQLNPTLEYKNGNNLED